MLVCILILVGSTNQNILKSGMCVCVCRLARQLFQPGFSILIHKNRTTGRTVVIQSMCRWSSYINQQLCVCMCGHLRCSSNGYLFIINMSINGQRVTLFWPAAVAEFFPSSFLTDFISFRWTSKWDPIRPDPGLFLWEIQSDRPEDIVRWRSRRREWG